MEEVHPGLYLIDENEEGGGWRELTWFVDTAAGGVLVNPTEFGPATAKAVDRLGGARFIVLTDGQNVGDVCKFKDRYRARIVVHRDAVGAVAPCAPDDPFDKDFSLVLGVRVLVGAGPHPGAALLYIMRDRGYLLAGDLMTIDGGRGKPVVRLRSSPDTAAVRRTLVHLRSLRFAAVMPSHTRHQNATHVLAPNEALVDALLKDGFYAPPG